MMSEVLTCLKWEKGDIAEERDVAQLSVFACGFSKGTLGMLSAFGKMNTKVAFVECDAEGERRETT